MTAHQSNAGVMIIIQIVTSLAAIGVLWATVVWLTAEANLIAADQSRQRVEAEISAASADLAAIVQHTARWDNAYLWVMSGDAAQITSNIGSGTGTHGPFDYLFVTQPDGRPLYAFEGGERLDALPSDSASVIDALLLDLQGEAPTPFQTTSAYDLMDGELVLASASRIHPQEADPAEFDATPILIGMMRFDQSDIHDASTRLGLDRFQLDDWGTPAREGSIRAALRSATGQPVAFVSWFPARPGDTTMAAAVPVILTLSLILIMTSMAVGRGISRQTNAVLQQMMRARTDNLTGLLNRGGLEEAAASQEMSIALARGRVAVIYFDLNDFKPLNDNKGHAAGDIALQVVAERLQFSCRKSDIVARVGGDEFVCVVIDDDPEMAAHEMVNRLKVEMTQPINRDGLTTSLSISHGIAVSGLGGSWQDVMRMADDEMYKTKNRRRKSARTSKTAA